jgi:hypothetical protein
LPPIALNRVETSEPEGKKPKDSGRTKNRNAVRQIFNNRGSGLDSPTRAEKNELEGRAIKKAVEVLKSSKQEWGLAGYDDVEDAPRLTTGR